jgi:hypothetical protein
VSCRYVRLVHELLFDCLEDDPSIAGAQLTQLTVRVSGKPNLIGYGLSTDASLDGLSAV